MKVTIQNRSVDGISGTYEGNETQPQCTWSWSARSGIIRDLTETSSVVVGYANTEEEAIAFLES